MTSTTCPYCESPVGHHCDPRVVPACNWWRCLTCHAFGIVGTLQFVRGQR